MQRFYWNHAGRQIHVRVQGRGAPIVLLHALPLWSGDVARLASALAPRRAVIAPDLAGYGLSDPLPRTSPKIADYADDVLLLLEGLGVRGAFALYAAEDAAPIALETAARARGRVTALVLDAPCELTESERESLLARGLPSYAPDPSGSHLTRLWHAARSRWLFRPTHEPRFANRLDVDMASPGELDEVVKAYMRAGEHWADGVRAGLSMRIGDGVAALATPTLVLADGRTPAERLPKPSASTHINCVGSDSVAKAAVIERFLGSTHGAESVEIRRPTGEAHNSDDFVRKFIPVAGGHLHARVNFRGAGRPVLALHDPAGSHQLVLSFVRGMLGTRPIVALDMPANGESDNTVGTGDVTSADYARAVIEAVDSLGLGEIDVIGRYSGGPVGMEMSFQRPALVKHLVQAAIALYRPQDVADVLAHYTPDVSPSRDGAHLVYAWFNMYNQALYWPWFRQTRDGIVWGEPLVDPELIHQRVFDLLRVGNMYQKAYRAMWTYPMEQRLPLLAVPTLLCAPRWDPIFDGLEGAHRAGPQCRRLVLPDRFADWAAPFMAFFDDAAA